MHSDAAGVKQSIRTYLMVGAALFVFTAITVAVNQIHLAVPMAITVALLIATTKGTMVASVFMHLSHEKKWITPIADGRGRFLLLIFLPLFTIGNGIGTPIPAAHGAAEHAGRQP